VGLAELEEEEEGAGAEGEGGPEFSSHKGMVGRGM
jgi:hypothetical protein